MTNAQLYLAMGVPMLFNAVLIGLFWSHMNARFEAMSAVMNARFDTVNTRFDAVNTRFDDMKDLWRAELHKVEEVLDARLTHLEKHLDERS